MPNIQSAKKRVRHTERRTFTTAGRRRRTASFVKQCETALDSSDREAAKTALDRAISELARSAGRGIIPARRASRKTSRLALRFAKMDASAPAAKG